MKIQSKFEAAFIAQVKATVNDPDFYFAWGRAPQGQPVEGRKEVVFFYTPGGERDALLAGGVSAEHGRQIQVSVFSVLQQDCLDAAKAIHTVLDGWGGTLSDGSRVFIVVPAMQDRNEYINDEKVFQTVFEYSVRMIEG
jgi:hypothetical protein